MVPDCIVNDGARRAYLASIHRVRADVQREFSSALEQAGFLRRILLRVQINREIKHRMREIAPPWALYLRQKPPRWGIVLGSPRQREDQDFQRK